MKGLFLLTSLSHFLVRMLLKSGYRHVYISRAFAKRHGFIPKDAQPGLYGYGGLVKYVLTLFSVTVMRLTFL